jgi:hypothetical protein
VGGSEASKRLKTNNKKEKERKIQKRSSVSNICGTVGLCVGEGEAVVAINSQNTRRRTKKKKKQKKKKKERRGLFFC